MTLRASQFWQRLTPQALSEAEHQALVDDHKARFGEFWEEALRVTLEGRNATPAAANADLFDDIDLDADERRRQQTRRFCERFNQHEAARVNGPERRQQPQGQPRQRAADAWAKVSPIAPPRDFPA